jgi:hypothetical protein
MPRDVNVRLLRATPEDATFIVEMARQACVIEDWPLPDADSEDTRSLLPGSDATGVVASDETDDRVGAAWMFHHAPRFWLTPKAFRYRRSPSPSCRR